jgi:hypothetical protein
MSTLCLHLIFCVLFSVTFWFTWKLALNRTVGLYFLYFHVWLIVVFFRMLSVHCFLVNMFLWFFELGLDVEISGIEPGTVETDVQVSKYSKTSIICHEFLLTVMVVSQCCGRCRRKSAFIFFSTWSCNHVSFCFQTVFHFYGNVVKWIWNK